jgi:hypothetical protein
MSFRCPICHFNLLSFKCQLLFIEIKVLFPQGQKH